MAILRQVPIPMPRRRLRRPARRPPPAQARQVRHRTCRNPTSRRANCGCELNPRNISGGFVQRYVEPSRPDQGTGVYPSPPFRRMPGTSATTRRACHYTITSVSPAQAEVRDCHSVRAHQERGRKPKDRSSRKPARLMPTCQRSNRWPTSETPDLFPEEPRWLPAHWRRWHSAVSAPRRRR